jgi:hypothetical protein
MKYEGENRRLTPRFPAKTEVRIRIGSKSELRRCINLSAYGCAVETENMALKKKDRVEITFMIQLGKITKLHTRMATVIYVKNGITGFSLAVYGEKFADKP